MTKYFVYTFDIYLKSIGYTTVSFVNPVEALNYFNKNVTNCTLIITDYGMPQMSGFDLIKKIRETDRNHRIKIIVISATVKNDIINYNDKFLNLKVDKFLEKHLSLEKLKNEINSNQEVKCLFVYNGLYLVLLVTFALIS